MRRLNTILLVDDDEITNYIHEELIRDLDVCENVVATPNGREALDYIRAAAADHEQKKIPELIFLDINMPEMNGVEFVKAIEQEGLNAGIKVVIMVTTELSSSERLFLENSDSIIDFKEKPLRSEEIVNLISKNAG